MHAPATTGPAKGPLPASSTPAYDTPTQGQSVSCLAMNGRRRVARRWATFSDFLKFWGVNSSVCSGVGQGDSEFTELSDKPGQRYDERA